MNEQSTTDLTLADLEHWSEIARDIDPPIRSGCFRGPGGTLPFAADAKRGAPRVRDQDAICAVSHSRANELRSALRFVRELDFVGINLTCRTRSRG